MGNLKYLRMYGYKLITSQYCTDSSPPVSYSGAAWLRFYPHTEQFVFLLHYSGFVKLTFPLNFNLIACPLYLFNPRQRLFIAFGQRLSTDRFHVSKRLACTAVIVESQKFIYGSCFCTVTVYTVMRQFWRSVFAAVSSML